jgi:peptidoglycan/xylan/chitin deacetylase (PgdA/CDA1 family)
MTSKLRRFFVLVVAGVLYHSGLLRLLCWLRRAVLRRREICVLAFHRVLSQEEEAQANSLAGMVLKEATFAKLLAFLQREFRIVPLDALLRAPQDLSKPLCLLTFDDGWRDNFTVAYPWLKRYGAPATIFLTTGMLETQGVFWVEQLSRAWRDPARRQQIQARFREARPGQAAPGLEEIVEACKRLPAAERGPFLEDLSLLGEAQAALYPADQMLMWDQVKEMSSSGIEFGSHTVTHPLLTYEDDATVERELCVSKQTLQERLGKEVGAFAYPNGDWNERVRKMVKDAGYQLAFTTRRRWYRQGEDLFAIPRIMLHEGNVTGLDGKFSAAMLALRLCGWR